MNKSLQNMATPTLIKYDENYVSTSHTYSNTGVICYLNSLLQSLLSCSAINQLLLKYEGDNIIVSHLKRCATMQILNRPYYEGSSILLQLLRSKLAANDRFGSGQEDSGEAFNKLLDVANYMKLNELFTTRYRSRMLCLSCKTISEINTPFQTFIIDIQNANNHNDFVDNILNRKYEIDRCCESCGNRNMMKHDRLTMISTVMMLSYTNKYYQKSANFIPDTFMINTLDGRAKFRLVAQIDHMGSMNGGHYYATCQRRDGVYCLNDMSSSKTQFTNGENVVYLFYHFESIV